jgi:iron complex transport system ATP-binding protein
VLELSGLGFAYLPGRWVFRGVSLTVPPGTTTAVIGPNGRGKTTLVRCAAGLLEPTEGTVTRACVPGFVPQAHGSTFAYRVLDMVLMGRARHIGPFSVPGSADVAAARAAIERVGIRGLEGRPFPALSGGEQQLALIARAVASGSTLLVLDEPAAGLDLRNQSRVLALLRELAGEGLAVLLTTHHPDHALHLADRVVLMHGPESVECGPATALLTEERLTGLYAVPVHCVEYAADGVMRRAIVTGYGAGSDVAAPTEAARLSPGPPPGRTARPLR